MRTDGTIIGTAGIGVGGSNEAQKETDAFAKLTQDQKRLTNYKQYGVYDGITKDEAIKNIIKEGSYRNAKDAESLLNSLIKNYGLKLKNNYGSGSENSGNNNISNTTLSDGTIIGTAGIGTGGSNEAIKETEAFNNLTKEQQKTEITKDKGIYDGMTRLEAIKQLMKVNGSSENTATSNLDAYIRIYGFNIK
ncbi:MAG: hypothetical protein PHS92_01515 [Candidatus Gracilibacteria bacterium]|nr:hypothetical protein [Candidatus Gracilibacteria bacterium]